MSQIDDKFNNALRLAAKDVKNHLLKNVVLPIVRQWLECNASLKKLEENINSGVHNQQNAIQDIVKDKLLNFETEIKLSLQNIEGNELRDPNLILSPISKAISSIIGVVGITIISVIAGGEGMALIALGPVGIVIGVVVGIFAFVFGRSKIEEIIKSSLYDKKIPVFIKKRLKNKISSSIKQKEKEIEDSLLVALIEATEPVKEAIDSLSG